MKLDLSSEQTMLKESVDRFLQQNYHFDIRRKLAASDLGYGKENWQQFAELGWLSVPFAEENDGFGGSMVDVILVTEALGKALATEPFVANLILGGRLVELLGGPEHKQSILPSVMGGELQLALAHSERHAGSDPAFVSCRAEPDGDDFVLTGQKIMVLNGHGAHKLLVTARSAGAARERAGIEIFLVDADRPGVQVHSYPTIDGMRAANVSLQGVRVSGSERLGDPGSNIHALETVIDQATVASSAEAIGAMDVLNRDTVEFAKTRKQFGQPISKYQVLQFRMVDMWLAHQKAQSALYMAALLQSEGGDSAKRATSGLKVTVSKAARFIGEQAIQIHGGIGTSDELRVGHYFKRLLSLEALHGGLDYHLDRYSSLMEGQARARA